MMFFRSSLFRLLVLFVSLGLCVSALRTIVGLWQRRDLITNRQKDLTRIASENASLQTQLRETATDWYVERVARNKLGMVKDGETIVLLPENGKTEAKKVNVSEYEPNWKKWWNLLY